MKEIKVTNEIMPVIEINFDEMKTALTETLKKYNGIVVTEGTLSGCKSTQKELAGVRIKIDSYRKDKKKELSKPIITFENQCKELIALIEQAEQPIKDGIKVFDDEKREEKRKTAEELIKIVIEEQGLNEKYGQRLDISEKYCNLTAKENDVKNDLIARAMTLRIEQEREEELIDIIKDSIESENQRINTKLDFKDFVRLIEGGMATKDILQEVKARAESIHRAENPEPIEEVAPEPTPEPTPKPTPKPVEEPIYCATYRITGSLEELRGISQYLKDEGIGYKVIEQGEI